MKSLKILLVLFTLNLLIACDKDNDDISRSAAEAQQLNLIVKDGEWRITEYTLGASNNTASFSDYLFNFEDNNNLLVSSSVEEINGTWRVSNDAGSETDSYNDVDFNIFFSSGEKMAELTNNYDVISATSEEVRLVLENQSSENTVFLTFSKN